jgi:hypothetical protein
MCLFATPAHVHAQSLRQPIILFLAMLVPSRRRRKFGARTACAAARGLGYIFC